MSITEKAVVELTERQAALIVDLCETQLGKYWEEQGGYGPLLPAALELKELQESILAKFDGDKLHSVIRGSEDPE